MVSILPVYSDNILHSTLLIGGYMPILVIATIAVLSMAVNPLLGRRRFSAGEMTLAIAMMLVACSVPTSGLLRYFPPQLASTVFYSTDIKDGANYINALPDALLPTKDPTSVIIRSFLHGIDPIQGETLASTWQPWIIPYIAWAFFLVPMMLAVMFICALMRKQWVVNERLSFPLATIQMELIADPEPGRRFNPLWRNRLLWIGILIPLVIHTYNGLGMFHPTLRRFPLEYDITQALSEYPWNTLAGAIKQNAFYFSMIGITFFVSLDVAFSIWFFYVAHQFLIMGFNRAGIPSGAEHATFQGFGIWAVYAILIAWISRHHLLHVARNILAPREPEEFLAYRSSIAGTLVCIICAAAFLIACGLPWYMAFIGVVVVLVWMTILSRIVMEAGVILVQFPGGADAFRFMGVLFSTVTTTVAAKMDAIRNFMIMSMTFNVVYTDQRESLMPFAANALRMTSDTPPRSRRSTFFLLAFAVLTALLVSGATNHILTYTYGRQNFDNGYGPRGFPTKTLQMARDMAEPEVTSSKANRPLNFGMGAAAMLSVGFSRLAFATSPFHPIGLLMLNTWAITKIWFSVMIGWGLKFAVLRWGGAGIYRRARPFFMGLIVGESLASILWVIVGAFIPWPDASRIFQILPN